ERRFDRLARLAADRNERLPDCLRAGCAPAARSSLLPYFYWHPLPVGGRVCIAGSLDNQPLNMIQWLQDPHAINPRTVDYRDGTRRQGYRGVSIQPQINERSHHDHTRRLTAYYSRGGKE